MIFELRSPLPVPAAEAYAFHARPAAFERLSPPWESVRVIKRERGIEDGGRVELAVSIGPFSKRWVTEHGPAIPGQQFFDHQVKGPFAKFEHTHRFEQQGAMSSLLVDHVEYQVPLGALGHLVAGRSVHNKLARMFEYRHRVTQADLMEHALYRDRPRLHVGITGATGLVGGQVAAFFSTGGHRVTKLIRSGSKAKVDHTGIPTANWNVDTGELEFAAGDFPQAIVHLAGENIAGARWSAKVQERIKSSRVVATHKLCERLAASPQKPKVLVCASAVGFYGNRGDERLTEESSPGAGFLAEVCQEWEAATQPAVDAGIRVVNLRFGMIVTTAGGALAKLLPPFRLGGGGVVGDGRQYWSWIVLDDVIGVIHHAIMCEALHGPVNAVAPEILTNREFTKILGRVLHRPTIVPLPSFAARLMLGGMADELLLASSRVIPTKLEETKYAFRFPTLAAGLRHVLGTAEQGSA